MNTTSCTAKMIIVERKARRSEKALQRYLVNAYYELVTLFYEWGWGQSFHFAYQIKDEPFRHAIARHEYFLAGKLGVLAGEKVLDVGCGIGGPMRNIAKFTKANVVGVTLNEYQVIRGNELNKNMGLLYNDASSEYKGEGQKWKCHFNAGKLHGTEEKIYKQHF